ncbi:hypothetical protein [Halosimplex pelagicum]|uniref:Uncharacterized protein n=1 Tax=Halosimplex pelagicum TaxID=869886 RepID=A0A7D5PBG4_9EURY|nr:hypothetical protein [Halosimplex pelagicum]QLH82242.1 hypothetical protein HZS54_11755 [Halosimplex pelagicum]
MKSIPPYLREVLEEAAEYHDENEDVSQVGAAHEIAYQNDSLVRMDEGSRDALDVLKDIQFVHPICADEFETYRASRNADYADSILEAVALRSLEELINVHLDDNQSFEGKSVPSNREIEYIGIDNPDVLSNIQVHVTAKEAVDIENAIADFLSKGDVDHPMMQEAKNFNRLWKGGLDNLNDTTIMLTSAEDVSVLLTALTGYEPREADFTTRIRHVVLEAIESPKSPIDPDEVETFTFGESELTAD